MPGKTSQQYFESNEFADRLTERFVNVVEKSRPVRKIQSSHVLSGIIGAVGLALFLVGVEKVFDFLSGWQSVLLGIILLAVSGALFSKLTK